MTARDLSRREVLRGTVAAMAVPSAGLCSSHAAQENSIEFVDATSPQARALNYQVQRSPALGAALCDSCVHFSDAGASGWGACVVFAGAAVQFVGRCKMWQGKQSLSAATAACSGDLHIA